MIIGGIVVLFIIIFAIVSMTSEKFKCTSDSGSITLMYNDSSLVGYTTVNHTFEFDEQQEYAEEIGIDAYLEEFEMAYELIYDGTCEVK